MTRLRAIAAAAAVSCAACGPDDDDPEGACSEALLPGDLVITEVFADADAPSGGSGIDDGREWFEVYNATGRSVAIDGLTIFHSREDGSSSNFHRVGSVTIAAGDFVVLGNVLPDLAPDWVDYGYANALGDLFNTGAGKLSLRCADTEIDGVIYGDVVPGESRQLDGGVTPDYTINDDLGLWCAATPTAEFDPANYGTPGDTNQDCEIIVSGMCDDNGTPRATVVPIVGDLVITEVMPSPDLADDVSAEWFEAVVTRDVDLNGVGLDRAGDSANPDVIEAEACLRVTAGTHVVFARSDDMLVNGGLPRVDGTFDFTMIGGSMIDPGDVAIVVGTTLIDSVTWTSSTAGASLQLDPDFVDPIENDDERVFCDGETAYGAGDLGTPGASNAECAFPPPPGHCDDGGTFRPIVLPQIGELVITEFMANPVAVVDAVGEWFEVLVLADFDLNSVGLDRAGDAMNPNMLSSVTCTEVTAGQRLVFARSDDPLLNGGLPPVSGTFAFSLVDDGNIQIVVEDAPIDSIEWTTTSAGVSIQVDPDFETALDNDDPLNRCDSTTPYGDGDLGSPGGTNIECPIVVPPGSCLDATMMVRPIDKPAAGEIAITEFHPDPVLAADGSGEWFEIRAAADFDLNQLQIGDHNTPLAVAVSSTDCLPVTAGAYRVFAERVDPTMNGNVTGVVAAFPSGVDLVNSGTPRMVTVGVDDIVLATASWTSQSAGLAIQVDSDGTQCNAPTGTPTYNDGSDLGTPNAVHAVECP